MNDLDFRKKHIYCLEGNWNKHPRSKQSIKPILELLETFGNVKYIYNRCITKDEFVSNLEKFTHKRYKNYTVLYIAFHGRRNKVIIGNETITLKEISNVLAEKLEGKIVHFGSCSTLGTSEKNIADFITTTKCEFISGYKKDVDYIDSTAFELLYFDLLQYIRSIKSLTKSISRKHQNLINKLFFCIKTTKY